MADSNGDQFDVEKRTQNTDPMCTLGQDKIQVVKSASIEKYCAQHCVRDIRGTFFTAHSKIIFIKMLKSHMIINIIIL